MKRILLFVFITLGINFSSAQTTILDQSLLTQESFDAFTKVNVTGTQSWYLNTTYGAICNGFAAGQSFENEDWLVSPVMNLAQVDNVKLTFNHTRGNAGVLNVGVSQGWYKVFATADFTGNPATTQWTELTFNQNVPVAWQYISSGELVIPEAAKSANSRIAFKYISSTSQSATWEIKNVKVVGDPQSTNPAAGIFKITNWNLEWLGCTTFGPTDETLQINNIASAMLAMNSDVFCIQEVSNTTANPSIATLVSLMGEDQWEGKIIPVTTGDCDQSQAVIYKKSRVQFVSSTLLSTGIAAQGNTYYYNNSNGRFPAVYNLNLLAGNTIVPVSVVNIHAKSEDNVAASYIRRLGASEALKNILDGASYNSKNLIIIGDFNDYLVGTSSTTCNCTDSPYKNFMDDVQDYSGVTQSVTNAWGSGNPVIENTIISNELFGNYVANSAVQEIAVAQSINNHYGTTSHHLALSTTFQFPVLSNPDFAQTNQSQLTIYPNPVKDILKFESNVDADYSIFDLTGRQMHCREIDGNTVDVSNLPVGTYILKRGVKSGTFLKM